MQTRPFFVLFLIGMAMAPARAGETLAISVTPSIAFEPANVTVRATMDATDDNRTLEVIADSGEYYRSSVIQLDGDRAPRTTQVSFRSLPSGSYTVRVIVRGSRGETRMQSERVDRSGA